MKKFWISIILMILLLGLLAGTALAQAYAFNIPEETVHVYWNTDGTVSLDYLIVFNNDPGAHAIDYVDLGLPNASFVDSSITADVNGVKVSEISRSGFQGNGTGVAIGLGSQTIATGGKGSLHVHVGTVKNMLQPGAQVGQVSAVFAPAWFTTAHGETNLTVVFHFPKGVGEQDATYHASQPGWKDQPSGQVDDQGLVTFTWNNSGAAVNHMIEFGASFPSAFVPAPPTAISSPPVASSNTSGNNVDSIIGGMIAGVIMVIAGVMFYINQKNKPEYVSPKLSEEGYGIKRGLTAVQAAVVLDEPIDKTLTMILFSVVKKGAAQVINDDPLEIKVTTPSPEGLLSYEKQFLAVFTSLGKQSLQEALEPVMINLFKDVNQSMEGFLREPTKDYYRSIVKDAWDQVEAADTPEVASQKLEENLDWAMLYHQAAPRAQRIFENKPVSLPAWWTSFDPRVHPAAAHTPQTPAISAPTLGAAAGAAANKISLPVLPGADFAASVVRSTQNFSGKVLGEMTAFTNTVKTKAAPPLPPPVNLRWSSEEPRKESRHTQPSTQGFWDSFIGSESGSSGGSHSFRPRPSGGGGFRSSSGSRSGGGRHCACACAGGGR